MNRNAGRLWPSRTTLPIHFEARPPTSAGQFLCPTSKSERRAGTGLSRCGPRESADRLVPFPLSEVPSMNDLSSSAALQAASPSSVPTIGVAGDVFAAAKLLLPHLERGRSVDSGV